VIPPAPAGESVAVPAERPTVKSKLSVLAGRSAAVITERWVMKRKTSSPVPVEVPVGEPSMVSAARVVASPTGEENKRPLPELEDVQVAGQNRLSGFPVSCYMK
jgi:hypothetical protein